MTWTEDEAFAVQQLQEEVRFLKNVIGRWRLNGADSFFQESGFRFGTNFDIGDQGFQVRAPEDTVSIVWLNDFLPAFDATTAYPHVKISGTTDPTDADSGTELNLSSWRSATQTSEVGISSDDTTARVQLSATSAAGGNAVLEIRAGDGSAGALVRVEESRFRVGVFTSDPSVLTDGEVWYRSDSDKFRGRANGATDNFAMEGWVTSAIEAATPAASWTDLTDGGTTTLHSHAAATRTVSIQFVIDGGGSAITTGLKGFMEVPFAMTITGWTILGDQSGSIVVDVWKDTYANYPPTVGDTIAGTEKPTLSTAIANQDLSLSTWTTAVSAGDILGFNVDSATTVTRVVVSIRGTVP